MTITRQQLVALWHENDLSSWLIDGPGNCYCLSRESYPHLHEAAAPFNVVFSTHYFKLGNEYWCCVLCCGHVIVQPFRYDPVSDEREDIADRIKVSN